MSVCAYCGYTIVGSGGICAFHSTAVPDDWARDNRMMCDLIHRGIVVSVSRETVLLEAA